MEDPDQANCLSMLKRWKPALAASKRVIEADKAWWGVRGRALFYLERWDEAADSLQEALNRKPAAEQAANIRAHL